MSSDRSRRHGPRDNKCTERKGDPQVARENEALLALVRVLAREAAREAFAVTRESSGNHTSLEDH
jgi:hypothetical protein